MNERGAIVGLAVPARGPELYALGGRQSGIIQSISQPFDHTVDVQQTGRAENDVEQHLALNAPPPSLLRVRGPWLEYDLDRLQSRLGRSLRRSGATLRKAVSVAKPTRHNHTIAASLRRSGLAGTDVAESRSADGAANSMSSARAIAFVGSLGQFEGTDARHGNSVAAGIGVTGDAIGIAKASSLNLARRVMRACRL